jgi:hypothetical protein
MRMNPHNRFDRTFQFDGFFRTATGRERYHDTCAPQRSDAPFRSRLGKGGFPSRDRKRVGAFV